MSPPCLRHATARAKSCCVTGCRAIRSSGPRAPSIRCKEARSGFRRKNSRQKPSVFSPSGSISSYRSGRIQGQLGRGCIGGGLYDGRLRSRHTLAESRVSVQHLVRVREMQCPRTLNNASYSCTIFCWKISGRACCVRGEASMSKCSGGGPPMHGADYNRCRRRSEQRTDSRT